MSLGVNGSSAGANNSGWKEVARYSTAGSYTWTCPKTATYGVFVVGGGGSGARMTTGSNIRAASGGASGFSNDAIASITQGQSFDVVVGSGGASVSTSYADGNSGEASSFGPISASGGDGGKYTTSTSVAIAYGAVSLYVRAASTTEPPEGKYGIEAPIREGSTPVFSMPWLCRNPFTGEQCLASGGGTHANSSGSVDGYTEGGKNPFTGLGGGDGGTAYNISGQDATEFGCGGGGCCGASASSGAGAAGIVIIYEKCE